MNAETQTTQRIDSGVVMRSDAWRRWLVIIWLAALLIRVFFVHEVLAQHSAEQIVRFDFDSREYVHLAGNLAERGRYAGEGAESKFFALLRTPGYPVFCALPLKIGWGIAGVLYLQAVIGSFIPVFTAALAGVIFGERRWGVLAGILAAISTTGIGLSGIVLADLLFATIIIGAFSFMCAGAACGKTGGGVGAGVLLAIGVLVKPAIAYFAPVTVLMWVVLARGAVRRVRWGQLTAAFVIPLLAVAGWSLHNRATTGRAIFCTVEEQNLRHFLAPMAEESGKASGLASYARISANHQRVMQRDLDDMMSGRLTAMELADRQKAEAMALLRGEYGWLTLGMMKNSSLCLVDGWAWTGEQMPKSPVLRNLMYWLNLAEIGLRVLALGLLVIAAVRWWRRRGVGIAGRPVAGGMAACVLLVAYFVAISGTSFDAGYRIIFPIEFAIILLGIGGIRYLMISTASIE